MKTNTFILAIFVIFLLGCSSSTPIASLTPTITSIPTQTLTPSPSSTPKPTATPTLLLPSSIVFSIEDGVKPDDIKAIQQGIAIVHNYLETTVGGDETTNWPNFTVSVFNSSSNESCCLGLTKGSNGLNEPGPRFYTLHPEWSNNPLFPNTFIEHEKHSDHEYTHAWQGSLGCIGGRYGQPLGRWLTEGMAEYIAWNSLIKAGVFSHKQVIKFHVDSVLSQTGKPDFQSWENPDNLFDWWAYNYAYLAVEKLVEDNGGPIILRKLCDEAAKLAPVTNLRDYLNLNIAMKNLGIDKTSFYDELSIYFEEVLNKNR
ncbi:MAG: hypothetical protein JNM46_10245 [Anaerolineales bacterium]|nr:hypothetical protein [Anaerolineales bacterium]